MPTQSEAMSAERGGRNQRRSIFRNFAADSEEENADGESNASSPLTPGEKGHSTQPHEQSTRSNVPNQRETILPLPEDEGGGSALPLQHRIDVAVARSFVHRLIAKAYEYPDEQSWNWLSDSAIHDVLRTAVKSFSESESLYSAAENFIRALRGSTFEEFLTSHLFSFGHAARGPNPVNEIEYGELKADPLFQPHRLADLAAFYRAFGLDVAEDASERQDHICIELEFMSVLAAKEVYALEHQIEDEALATLRSAQKQFIREHLGRWVPAFARRLARAAGGGVISALADFTREFVLAECARFGVNAGRDDIVLRPIDEAAEAMCASCGINQLPPGALTAT
jgi:putative dimethyl sulfoxide reductase chaperone